MFGFQDKFISQELFDEIDQEKDGEIYLKEIVLYLRAMNEQMESLEVRLGRLSEVKTYINTGQALAGQVRAEGDGDTALCWVRDYRLRPGIRIRTQACQ